MYPSVPHHTQAYNSLRGPTRELLTSPQQWATALLLPCWPRNNGKINVQSGKSKASADGSASSSGDKRMRASKYSFLPDGEQPWPPHRLNAHCIGRHPAGKKNTFCDYPQCQLQVEKESTSTADSASKRGKGRTSDDVSETGSEDSNASVRGGGTRMYCEECYDPSGTRHLNFCEDCWNRWHGLKNVKKLQEL